MTGATNLIITLTNMKYLIGNKVEDTTAKTGTQYKKFNVKDEKGVVTEGVTAFSFFNYYSKIAAGAEVEGILEEKDYNGRKSYSLVNGNLGAKPAGMGGGMGAKLVEQKSKNIEHAQDRKSESIMISSTAGQATDILVAKLSTNNADAEAWHKEWLEIRYWLVKNWNNIEQPKVGNTGIDYPQNDIDPNDVPF